MPGFLADLSIRIRAEFGELTAGVKQATTELERVAEKAAAVDKAYQKNMDNLAKSTGQVASKIGGYVTGIMGGFAAFGSVVAAVKATIDSTEGSADSFKATVAGITTATETFFTMVATGDFSNFLTNLENAAKAGKDYAEAMELIEKRKLGLTLTSSASEEKKGKLQEVFVDKSYSGAERKKALDEYIQIEKEEAKTAADIASQAVKDDEKRLADLNINTKAIKEYYSTVNKNIGEVTTAMAKMKAMEEEMTAASNSYYTTEQGATVDFAARDEHLAKAKAIQDGMTDGEKKYQNLIETNDKVRAKYQHEYLQLLIEEGKAAGKNSDVVIATARKSNSIKSQIEKDNEKASESSLVQIELQKVKLKAFQQDLSVTKDISDLQNRISEDLSKQNIPLEDKLKLIGSANELLKQQKEINNTASGGGKMEKIDTKSLGQSKALSSALGAPLKQEIGSIDTNKLAPSSMIPVKILLQNADEAYADALSTVKRIRAMNFEQGIKQEKADLEQARKDRSISEEEYASKTMAIDDKIKAHKIQNAQMAAQAVMGGLQLAMKFTEAAKNREIAAAGNNKEKVDAINKKYHKKEQKQAIAQAIINGALGVTSSLSGPPVYKWIEAALVAAATIGEVALISSQSFATGGYVNKPTLATVGDARGGGEWILNTPQMNSLLNGVYNQSQGHEARFILEQNHLLAILNKAERKNIYF